MTRPSRESPMATAQTRKPEPGTVSVEEAIEEFRAGHPVIILDNKDRENEGDVCIPAEFCTADTINFMSRYARGLICVAMTGERLDQLKIPLMVGQNTAPLGTAFTISVEARTGVTTG